MQSPSETARRVTLFCLCATALFLRPKLSMADQIELPGGKRILGKVEREMPAEVLVAGATGSQSVPVSRIVGIHYDGQGATLTQAQILEEGRNLSGAAEAYEKAERELTGKPFARQAAQFGHARVLAFLALAGSAGVDDAIDRLEAFATEHPESRHHYPLMELLGRLQLAKGEFATAAQTFDELAQAPRRELRLKGDLYKARVLAASNQAELALARLETIASTRPESDEEAQVQTEALLEKAACLRALQRRAEEALVLEQAIARLPARADALEAEACAALGDAYRASHRPKQALFAFLRIELLFAKHRETHALALYNLYQLWDELGQSDRADAARSKLRTEYPSSPWTTKLHP